MANTFRIYCGASDDLSLAIVRGEVVLTKADSRDDRQVWYKDTSYGAGITDEAGSPVFALVNKSTGDALKHSFGYDHPVRAVRFDPLFVDESVLWAESKEEIKGGADFRRIHMINNMDFIFDAERTAPEFGGARHGTRLILFRWNGGRNQMWRVASQHHSAAAVEASEHARCGRVLCQSGGDGLSLTVRDGTVVLATADHKDERQCWVQSFQNTGRVTDEEGQRAFVLVNRATGMALKHRDCHRDDKLVQLAEDIPDSVDVALLWTQSGVDLGDGFHGIRTANDIGLVLDAADSEAAGVHDGTPILVFPWHGGQNQKWKMVPFY